MSNRNSKYDPLFEPLAIGPVTTKNRFYQVPHCNGGGYRDPSAVKEMRRVKAEGGWGVVFTEQVEMHHSSEITPYIELRLWEDNDIPMLASMADGIHEGNALAGIELTYSGINGPNLYSREVPMAPSALPVRTFTNDPVSAKTMTLRDIKNLRRWYRQACRRAKSAGFDLICLYGAHGFGIIQHFLSSVTNQRTDQYGGSLENRSRLLRELISDSKEEVGDSIGITLRLALHEMIGENGFSNSEVRDLIAMHADLPDLWDLAHGSWEECSGTSRFTEEAAQADLITGIRELTDKPVVGVGRFTSPDRMLNQLSTGKLDLIGCARPSIADPWLPRKIAEGREEDIRECIGCNICVTGDMTMSLSRCTQNPSFMEEWRKGWHPEIVTAKGDSTTVLIIGAGPAGLEAAMTLGKRGYDVVLAEKRTELGGRVALECQLPGLAAWGRVRDYRVYQISQLPNVQVYMDNSVTAEEALDFGFEHIAIATGSHWRSDGVSRHHVTPMICDQSIPIYTPDDFLGGAKLEGNVLIFDDDHYYMGSVLAELLTGYGSNVTLITPSAYVSEWSLNTLEQGFIHKRLVEMGVNIQLNTTVDSVEQGRIKTSCSYSGHSQWQTADAIVLVTSQQSEQTLYHAILAQQQRWNDYGVKSVTVFGDAEAPAPIAWATYAGHRFASELDSDKISTDIVPFRRDVIQVPYPND